MLGLVLFLFLFVAHFYCTLAWFCWTFLAHNIVITDNAAETKDFHISGINKSIFHSAVKNFIDYYLNLLLKFRKNIKIRQVFSSEFVTSLEFEVYIYTVFASFVLKVTVNSALKLCDCSFASRVCLSHSHLWGVLDVVLRHLLTTGSAERPGSTWHLIFVMVQPHKCAHSFVAVLCVFSFFNSSHFWQSKDSLWRWMCYTFTWSFIYIFTQTH